MVLMISVRALAHVSSLTSTALAAAATHETKNIVLIILAEVCLKDGLVFIIIDVARAPAFKGWEARQTILIRPIKAALTEFYYVHFVRHYGAIGTILKSIRINHHYYSSIYNLN